MVWEQILAAFSLGLIAGLWFGQWSERRNRRIDR